MKVNSFSLYQMTPLHVAAEKGYIKIVDYLVGEGAYIDVQDDNGVTICDCSNNIAVLLL